jgi:hypothetical protein
VRSTRGFHTRSGLPPLAISFSFFLIATLLSIAKDYLNNPPGRLARAMSANLRGGGQLWGAKFAILGRGPPATCGFTKAKVAILGRGTKFEIFGWGPTTKGGPFAREGRVLKRRVYIVCSGTPTPLAPFLVKKPREFNGVAGERLKTVRMRGQISRPDPSPSRQAFPHCHCPRSSENGTADPSPLPHTDNCNHGYTEVLKYNIIMISILLQFSRRVLVECLWAGTYSACGRL